MKKAVFLSVVVLAIASLANATMVNYQVTMGDGSALPAGNVVTVTPGVPVTLNVLASTDTAVSGITSMFVWDTTTGSAGSGATASGGSKLVGSLATVNDPTGIWGGPKTSSLGGAQVTTQTPRPYGTYLSISQGSGLQGQLGDSQMVKLYSITITPSASFTGSYTGGLWYDGGTTGIGYRSYAIAYTGGAKFYPTAGSNGLIVPVTFQAVPEPITLALLGLGGLFLRRRMA